MKEIIIAYDDSESSPIMGEWVGELVRCKDCKNGTDDNDLYLNIVMCRVHERRFYSDWFCADAEPKET